MDYEYMNEEIRAIGKAKQFLLGIIGMKLVDDEPVEVEEAIDDDEDIEEPETFKSLLADLNVAYGKLNECYTHVPEITERDMWLDHYWDKKEEQQEAIAYGEELENKIRFQVLLAECQMLQSQITNLIFADPELAEVYDNARCAELDAELDYEMYGND